MGIEEIAKHSQIAALKTSNCTSELKKQIILKIAEDIDNQRIQLEQVNKKDVNKAVKTKFPSSLIKRLKLDDEKITEMVKGLKSLAQLHDPVGKVFLSLEMDKDLELYKVACPIGVIGAIFESRPDALVQIAALCLKSGNTVILKGGAEAEQTSLFLVKLIRESIRQFKNFPLDAVQLVHSREAIKKLLKLDKYVNLIIPRGSSSLVKYIKDNTKIPVLGHTEGICHEYVDADIDLDMAIKICFDAKVQYPAACNAMETLLVHNDSANDFLPPMAQKYQEAKVELRGDALSRTILPGLKKASPKDWSTEYLNLILSIKIVHTLDEAIEHINKYGSHHTDGIITENKFHADRFLSEVDSAVVLHNASTRFSDGYRFGFGAEVGISTEKIHARGPVGLEGLVTYKYIIRGNGQIVTSYLGPNAKSFTHRKIHKSWKN